MIYYYKIEVNRFPTIYLFFLHAIFFHNLHVTITMNANTFPLILCKIFFMPIRKKFDLFGSKNRLENYFISINFPIFSSNSSLISRWQLANIVGRRVRHARVRWATTFAFCCAQVITNLVENAAAGDVEIVVKCCIWI